MYEPIKALGQNFLLDTKIALDMVKALEIADDEDIVEIGPGLGVLTEYIVEEVRSSKNTFYAVDIDRRFAEKLFEIYAEDPNVKIIHEDILTWLPSFETQKECRLIGSLPYYITSPIIHGIIKMKKRPKKVVLLIQKEVAEKIKSQSPDSSYMSCFVQTFYDVDYLGRVPRDKFKPSPAVDGGIIVLNRRDLNSSPEFIRKYEGFLHKAFSNPRKMLNKMFTKEELQKGNIDSNLRAQNLSASQWLEFYKILGGVL